MGRLLSGADWGPALHYLKTQCLAKSAASFAPQSLGNLIEPEMAQPRDVGQLSLGQPSAGALFLDGRALQVVLERRVDPFRRFGLGDEAIAHGLQTQRDVLGEVGVEQEDRLSIGKACGDALV